jgi:hypothetical protein
MKKAYVVTLYNIYDATTEIKRIVALSESEVYAKEKEIVSAPGQHIQSIKKFLEVVEWYDDVA